ncbi:MAG: DUF1292 domain-containing protein [Erysipelotrichaceae bacterium]|nr:DUF1292 domain-containing protein [Erysipelotrichaceae bacterium]
MDTFKIINHHGEEVECEILFVYEDIETYKTYIVFTDHSVDQYGRQEVQSFIYNKETSMSEPIETEEEWMMLEMIFENLLKENDHVR